jgi:hypothetical protein
MSALALIHVAKKQLGLDEDTYRAALIAITGKASAGDMTEAERNKVVSELRKRGFKKASNGPRKRLEGKYAAKLQALWIAGYNLGIVENRSDEALVAFVKRQAQVDHVRFLHDPADAAKAIEGLKAWLSRAGGVDWNLGDLADWMRVPGARIAIAQWQKLVAAGLMEPKITVFRALVAELAKPVDEMAERDWPIVMNTLGERIRKARG